MRLDDEFQAAFLRVVGRVGHDFAIGVKLPAVIDAKSEERVKAELLRVVDLRARVLNAFLGGGVRLGSERGDGGDESGSGYFSLERVEIVRRGLGADERIAGRASQPIRSACSGLLHPVERDVEAPIGRLRRFDRLGRGVLLHPGTVEASDRPSGPFGAKIGDARSGGHSDEGGCS